MKIEIAGFNLDKKIIDQIPNTDIATPETISAAYARISRSKLNVVELRKKSLAEVQKARSSNQTIIFDMGHSSIAEHAVFNIDIIGVSRYLTEFIQRSRLASFTEKSQRYVTLQGDFVLPQEIQGTILEDGFVSIINKQNAFYEAAFQRGVEYLSNNHFSGTKTELEGKAKEDARYCLGLCTQTQMGMTINARSLAKLLKRLDAVELIEAKELKQILEKKIKEITPSLLRYTDAEPFEKQQLFNREREKHSQAELKLLSITPNGDDLILAAMLFEQTGQDFQEVLSELFMMKNSEKEKLYHLYFKDLKSYLPVSRHFELIHALFQVPMSSSCFAQWKRHRLSTIIRADYHPQNGYVVPQLLIDCNLEQDFEKLQNEVADFYYKLETYKQGLGNYILTNSHKLTILFQANLRELYHFSRLRSDKHAQWEIRELSKKMETILRTKLQFATNYLIGKDEFDEKMKNV
jgi:flavin-dependent thymidylate synthase